MTLSEAKKIFNIIKISVNKIDMVAPILEMVDDKPEVITKANSPKVETESKPVKREYNFKPKRCEVCGKEFAPHYGRQKICDTCKDIQDTARDIISGIND